MTYYFDQPDFQQAVSPGVTRWAPGTAFGNVSWYGTINAMSTHLVNYAIPDDGSRYVVDKTFLMSDYVGVHELAVSVCDDYGNPVWNCLGRATGEGVVEVSPFTFVSMSLRYPQGLQWLLDNHNNVTRTFWVVANFYRYVTTG